MQDRPTAQELIDAVAAFVSQEIAPTLDNQRLRFRALVAANVLSVVSRELAAGDAPLRAEWQRLTTLLDAPADPPTSDSALRDTVEALNHELCARIRATTLDDGPQHAAVFAHVRATVVDKLAIANPRYLQRVAAEREGA